MNTNPHKELNKSTEKPDPPLTVKELMAAVSDVSDWRALGIQLDLKMSQLENIHVSYHVEGVEIKKAEMFRVWLNNSSSASWNDLIKALKVIGKDKVASQIATQLSTATDAQLPTATDTQLPTATDTQLPTAADTQLSTATDTQLPTATDAQLPTATDAQLPTATDTQLPTATDTQLPTATDTQLPTATDTQLPTAAAGTIGDLNRTLSELQRYS